MQMIGVQNLVKLLNWNLPRLKRPQGSTLFGFKIYRPYFISVFPMVTFQQTFFFF